jgi:hypothetical protein
MAVWLPMVRGRLARNVQPCHQAVSDPAECVRADFYGPIIPLGASLRKLLLETIPLFVGSQHHQF